MYHRVLPANHPDRATEQPGMYVTPETLAMHLGVLREHFTFVHLDEWLDAKAAGRELPRHACAITFDDGWRDNYDHAFPMLRQAQVPATIYLVSDLVGTSYSFWPNTLARLLAGGEEAVMVRARALLGELPATQGGLDMAQIDAIIGRCKSRSDAEMHSLVAEIASVAPTAAPGVRDLMSWEEIDEMQRSGLVRFGSHTRRHTRLSKLPAGAQMDDE
ncbi:MAG: polysaccharide deacetylase family protein, partial [Peristeroidobacter soli]